MNETKQSETPICDAEFHEAQDFDRSTFVVPLDVARGLELENRRLLAELPLVNGKVRNEAERLLGKCLRHDDGNGASHGCVEVTAIKSVVELLVAENQQLMEECYQWKLVAGKMASVLSDGEEVMHNDKNEHYVDGDKTDAALEAFHKLNK